MAARAGFVGVALAPVLVFAVWDALDGDARGALVRLACIAPLAGLAAWWLGARTLSPGRAREPGEADKIAASARSAQPAFERAELAGAGASERAELACWRSRRIEQLARASLTMHADASRALASMSAGDAVSARADIEHIAVCARDLLHSAGSMARRTRCAHVLDDDPADADCDVVYALREVVDRYEPMLERLDVRVRVHVLDPPLPRCLGDIRSLQLVFGRLLEHAADALAGSALDIRCRLLDGGLAVELRWPGESAVAMSHAEASLCEHLVTRTGGAIELSASPDQRDGSSDRDMGGVRIYLVAA